jgi:mRNA interferase RelE/StbE
MSKYTALITRPAEKDLESLDVQAIKRIRAKLVELADSPFPQGFRKLTNSQSSRHVSDAQQFYRIRTGDYRIIYTVKDTMLLITVVKIAHRKDVYD